MIDISLPRRAALFLCAWALPVCAGCSSDTTDRGSTAAGGGGAGAAVGVGGTNGTGAGGMGVGGTGATSAGGTAGAGSGGVGATGSGGTAGTGVGGSAGGTGGSGGGGTSGTGGSGGDLCDGFANIVSETLFNQLYPLNLRHELYTYQGMVDAVAVIEQEWPGFGTTGDCDVRKREIAAFLANVSRETARLQFAEQINKDDYCDSGRPYGCPGGQYYGRGPIQLSWNYNYYVSSQEIFGDDRLLQNPNLVSTVPEIAWETGLWFWMTAGGAKSPHEYILDGSGFGGTIQAINGGQECGGDWPEAVTERVCWFECYTRALGTDVGPGSLDCGTTVSRPCDLPCAF